jgi:NAD(P)H-hydrate epimerase
MEKNVKSVVNAAQMQAVDAYTIEQVGIPAIVLMERAALAVVKQVKKHSGKKDRILVVCGIGNNGADGAAAARILCAEGYQADILLAGEEEKASTLAKQQLFIARNLGISIYNNIVISEYTIIIDAIFGIGLSRDVAGRYKELIEEINQGDHKVFSVDIPSGLSADTAVPMGVSIRSDYTITFGLNKIGLLLYPGCEYAGEITVADIGFPQKAVMAVNTPYFVYDNSDLCKLPVRKNYSNKGTYGKVLVIAGSANMSGACFFSAKAAYRMGAGLVKVLTAEENRIILQSQLPEALMSTYDADSFDSDGRNRIVQEIGWADAIVFGPGVGKYESSEALLELVTKHAKVPVILDADGINLLARKVDARMQEGQQADYPGSGLNRIEAIASCLPKQTVLTPHLKELSILLDRPLQTIISGLMDTADNCVMDHDHIIVLKDARTIVPAPGKRYINTTGNNGMATGGSGDVLTGIIAGLIAQGLTAEEAAYLGVYIHGLAGDMAFEAKGSYSLMAGDIIEGIAQAVKF